ncbi:MAG: hypothetical protein PWQ96_2238 [Clostridia bacterium]|jgi:hypothetical protein|nr:hypothetical protein [Clostridiales bacterium]MDK2986594.1 hypothetical protein [Clostridia bacterium]
MEKQDAKDRNVVEGKFGEGKRFYSLGRIMACLRILFYQILKELFSEIEAVAFC